MSLLKAVSCVLAQRSNSSTYRNIEMMLNKGPQAAYLNDPDYVHDSKIMYTQREWIEFINEHSALQLPWPPEDFEPASLNCVMIANLYLAHNWPNVEEFKRLAGYSFWDSVEKCRGIRL